MLSSDISQELVSTLTLRARGNRFNTLLDHAASQLASQLSLNTAQSLTANEKAALERSKWLDQQVIDFLTQYPTALGIELSAGVSTRFHRISNTLEWPQFRWADINTPETHAFNQSLLPITDNYRSLGCDLYQQDWLYQASWQPSQPLLILVESPTPSDLENLIRLFTTLSQRVSASNSPMCIALTCDSSASSKLLAAVRGFSVKRLTTFETSWVRHVLAKLVEQLGIRSAFTPWKGLCLLTPP